MRESILVALVIFILIMIFLTVLKYLWPVLLILVLLGFYNYWKMRRRQVNVMKDFFNQTPETQTPPNIKPEDIIDADYKERDLD